MILFVAGFSLASVCEVIPAYAQDSEQSLEDRIRSKVEADPAHPTLIRTVRGVGYRLERG